MELESMSELKLKDKNLCFLVNKPINEISGGTERVTLDLQRLLSGIVCNVIVVSGSKDSGQFVIQYFKDGGYFEKEERSGFDEIIEKYSINVLINQSERESCINLISELKAKDNLQLIHCLHTAPYYLVKVVNDDLAYKKELWGKYNYKSLALYLLNPYRKYLRRNYLRIYFNKISKLFDDIVVLDEGYVEDVISLSGFKQEDINVHVIPNPLTMQSENIENKEKIVLYVGKMCFPAKRPDRVLKIWRNICKSKKDWNLVMLGDGEHQDSLMKMASKMSLSNITFVGRANPIQWYKKSSLLFFTSTIEGYGLVIREAQSFNCYPVVFNSYSAAGTLIPNKDFGQLIEPFDISEFADKALLEMQRIEGNGMKATQLTIQSNIAYLLSCWELLLSVK